MHARSILNAFKVDPKRILVRRGRSNERETDAGGEDVEPERLVRCMGARNMVSLMASLVLWK